jgi:multiple antibiotic resistance protein
LTFNDIIIDAIKIFAVLNPISILPIFLTLSQTRTEVEKQKIVISAVTVAFAISIIVIFIGKYILEFVGITLDSFRFAGGILLLLSAIDMFSGIARGKKPDPESEGMGLLEIATVPLATPLLLGPGTITLLLTISYNVTIFDVLISTSLAMIISGVILSLGVFIKRIIHDSGIKLLSRLMALLVASVAIELMHTTLLAWGVAKF